MPNGTNSKDDAPAGDGVYPPLEDRGYDDPVNSERDVAMPVSLQPISSPGAVVGAKPIRWNWWLLALGVSVLLWVGIAKLLNWI